MDNGRAQCLVIRDHNILMVKHRHEGIEYFCLPGGGIEDGESPEVAAARELKEERLVNGTNLQLISSISHDYHINYTFYAEIGKQEPSLGEDPELKENSILVGVEWRTLDSICERDSVYVGCRMKIRNKMGLC